MKKSILLFLCAAMLLGCTSQSSPQKKQYTATFLDVFDTVTKVVGYADSESEFSETVQSIRDELEYYHKLFDIYNEYDGINNLKTVNDNAALSPVKVDISVIELLEDSKKYYAETGGKFNPAMGSVLRLWHDAREDGINDPANAYLPDYSALLEASEHTDPDDIVIDRENSTVFFADSELKLDVGAIAKGWAVGKVCENAPEGLLVSVGGNVCATGEKLGGSPWKIGIRDPESPESEYKNIHTLNITKGCVVTSGSYQRAYVFDGKLYHHIIDPETLYPSEYWTSVTVVCDDSGLADVLSTALFLLDLESGQELLGKFSAEAMWVDVNGNKYYSPNYEILIRNQ